MSFIALYNYKNEALIYNQLFIITIIMSVTMKYIYIYKLHNSCGRNDVAYIDTKKDPYPHCDQKDYTFKDDFPPPLKKHKQ